MTSVVERKIVDLELAGKAFIVTGGSTGLGLAGAQALVEEGANVVVVGRDPDRLSTAVDSLGDSARGVDGDLSQAATIANAISVAKSEFGRLDGAFISYGGPPAGGAETFSDEDLLLSMQLVALNPIRVAREVASELTEGGSILVLSSSTAKEVTVGMTGSNIARPGLEAYAKELATVVGPRGVRVNVIVPGIYATERLAYLDAARGFSGAEREAPRVPLRRLGEPIELGRVAAFLLSNAASYVNGASVTVDGGRRNTL
ncbi:SDR family oxidoreductase [Aeromicrobium alkaliterrae]|uniref:SDR family oxidoreductase n=1 Tax=Aeromicrobium alkaliterrae TaxID=302168 RepID=A0ABN2KF50_9ACTN